MSKKLTQAEFLAKAVAVHGVGRYDYSQAVYAGERSKIKIICPEHGAFEQLARNHAAKGQGCRECRRRNLSLRFRQDVNSFIAAAQLQHGVGRYDYSQVLYLCSTKKVKIMCPSHGVFHQTPAQHTYGNGCPSCGKSRMADIRRKNTIHFIKKAREIHGNKYDYSQSIYKSNNIKLIIGCPKHGFFEQTPGSHSTYSGCPKCARDKQTEEANLSWANKANGRTATLYFIRLFNEVEIFYKIGITYLSVGTRYSRPSSLAGYKYELLALHESNNAAAVHDWEQSILNTFAHLAYKPKQRFGGATECFSSSDEILSIFPL